MSDNCLFSTSNRSHNKIYEICLSNALQKVTRHWNPLAKSALENGSSFVTFCVIAQCEEMAGHHIQTCHCCLMGDFAACISLPPSISLSLSLRCVEQCLWALFCPCEPVTIKASGGTFNKPVPLYMLEDVIHAKAGNAESAAQNAVNLSSLICLCAIGCQNKSWAIGLLDSAATASVQSSTDSEIKVLCK